MMFAAWRAYKVADPLFTQIRWPVVGNCIIFNIDDLVLRPVAESVSKWTLHMENAYAV